MKKRSLEDLQKIEQAIKNKYGEDAIIDPSSKWDQSKEKDYLSQLKSLISSEEKENIQDFKDYSLVKRLITKDESICKICDSYLRKNDGVFVTKFECCEKCYILYVEGRENLWEERKKNILKDKVNKMNGE